MFGINAVAVICGIIYSVTAQDPAGPCGAPPTIQNGRVSFDSYQIREILRYTCNFGYSRITPNLVYCREDGRWIGNPPTCVPISEPSQSITCGPPPSISNGRAYDYLPGRPYNAGVSIHYTCYPGYDGGGPITCLNNGQWTSTPTCVPIQVQPSRRCGRPPAMSNGRTPDQQETYSPHIVIDFDCNDGYTGGGHMVCQDNGEWTSPPPCVPIPEIPESRRCGPPPSVSNGIVHYFRGEQYEVGRTLLYSCRPGYTAGGDRIICQANQQWTTPTCTPIPGIPQGITCGPPPYVSNGRVNDYPGPPYAFGSVLLYSCRPGYTAGGKRITCQINGRWTTPTCTQIPG